jgi:uncharacterized protein (TIGR02266 family)
MGNEQSTFITPEIEKRQYRRASLVVEVRCATSSRDSIHLTRDISVGGLFVSASDPFPAGSVVQVALRLAAGKSPLTYSGKVVHSLPGVGMGIEFDHLDAGARETLQKFVDETP